MSDTPDDDEITQPVRYDAPNQQVVREDGSGPADEGTGGSALRLPPCPRQTDPEPEVDEPDPVDPAAPDQSLPEPPNQASGKRR